MKQMQDVRCYKIENNFTKYLPFWLLKHFVKPTIYKNCSLVGMNILDVEGEVSGPEKMVIEIKYEEMDDD